MNSVFRLVMDSNTNLQRFAVYALALIVAARMNPSILALTVYLLIAAHLMQTRRTVALYYLLLASVFALGWVMIANTQYSYNHENVYVLGLNLFPLFAWASGLFLVYFIHACWEHRLSNPYAQITGFILFYWIMLLMAESLGYHVLDIQNLATAAHAGLPGCNCLHAPPWMQLAYIAMGPLYVGSCKLLGLGNPHK